MFIVRKALSIARSKISDVAASAPRISISSGGGLFLQIGILVVACAISYFAGWWGTASKRDAYWRAKIVEASKPLQDVARRQGGIISVTDKQIEDALAGADDDSKRAVLELQRRQQSPAGGDCAPVLVRCLGLRSE